MWVRGEKKAKVECKKKGTDAERKRIENEINTVSDTVRDSTVQVHESIILLPSLMWKSTAVPFM